MLPTLFHQQLVDTLEAARQLVTAAAALALVMLEVVGFECQGTLPGLQNQTRAAGQHGQIGQILLARGYALAWNADDLVALAFAQLRQVAHREQ